MVVFPDMSRPAHRPLLTLAVLALLLAAAVVLRLAVGRDGQGGVRLALEFLDERWPRALAAAMVGASLALAGTYLQTLLRNPLASPDILGLASGSGLGVMIAAYVAFRAGAGLAASESIGLGTGGAAILGALGAMGLVYALSQRRGLLDPVTLVLVGVAVSILASAGTMLVRHLLPDQGQAAGRLLLGCVRDATQRELWIVGAVTLAGLAVGLASSRAMDAASLSEDEARSVGVALGPLRGALFVASGVLTAGSVLLAGPVGFVGLIAPHVVRMLAGPRHAWLVPGAALAGAAMVVLCDALVRAIDLGTGQLPIGVLTSLVGGPVLIALLRRHGSR